MGEVYRATDTKLRRDVAIKVLPLTFVADKERLARFEREAQLLAQLQHPSIASIFGMEESSDTKALVMELVEGPTLAERLAQGPLSLDEALSLARQIAEALEEAHAKGIIHRDLKPQNIKISGEGKVKVLDFGLAKAMDPAAPASGIASASRLEQSPTLTLGATVQGVILGTAAYMAPEQARGSVVDARADIWAFGVILWEMLTGASLFAGDTVTDTLAAVLRADIDLDRLPPSTPSMIRHLLRRCIERNPKNRLHSIADARLVIDDMLAGRADAPSGEAAAGPAARAGRTLWLVGLSALALGVIGTLAVVSLVGRGQPASPTASMRTTIRLPNSLEPDDSDRPIALSPDGSRLVVVAVDAEGGRALYLRALDDLRLEPLAVTADASYPFWSPDGRSIGFFAGGKLRRLDLESGGVRTLCDAAQGRGASWGRRGTIVFSPGASGPLLEVSADGGTPAALTQVARDGEDQRNPHYLPDGRSVVFFARNRGAAGERAVYVFDPRRGAAKKLMDSPSEAIYVEPGYLAFVADGNLMLQSFDLRKLALSGSPRPIAADVQYTVVRSWIAADFSPNGALVYERDPGERPYELSWLDAAGNQTPAWNGPLDRSVSASLSPDGRRAVVVWEDGGHIIRNDILDFEAGTRARLGGSAERAMRAAWSPDGERILVRSVTDGEMQLAWLVPRPGESAHPLTSSKGLDYQPGSFTLDGRSVLFSRWSDVDQLGDVFMLDLDAGSPPRAILTGPGQEVYPRLSPSGTWMAFVSNASGREEIWVTDFPAVADRRQVSVGAAEWAFELRAWGWLSANELWWQSSGGHVVAARIGKGARGVEVEARQPLLGGRALAKGEEILDYSRARQRFLLGRDVGAKVSPDLVVVSDWRAALRAGEKAP